MALLLEASWRFSLSLSLSRCLSLWLFDPPTDQLALRQKPTAAQEQAAEYEKKKQNFITRTFWTFVMIGGFFAALFMGHIYMVIIVTGVQVVSFSEVIAIANVPSRARQLSSTKSLNWYWLATTMYFLYGESVIYYFKHIVLVDKVLLPLATHHRFISFVLYVIGESPLPPAGTSQPRPNSSNSRACPVLPPPRRLRVLCRIPPGRPLQVPVYPVRLDAHGPLPDRRPGPFRHEQHL